MRGASGREGTLRRLVAEGEGDVPMDQPLADLGMSSRDAVALAGELSRATGLDLPATLLWEAATGDALVERVCGAAADIAPAESAAPAPTAGDRDDTGNWYF